MKKETNIQKYDRLIREACDGRHDSERHFRLRMDEWLELPYPYAKSQFMHRFNALYGGDFKTIKKLPILHHD